MLWLRNLTFMSVLQRLADLLTVVLSFYAGYHYYTTYLGKEISYSSGSYMLFGLLSGLIFLIVLHSARLYEREISLLNLVETRGLLWVWLVGSMVTFTLTFYLRPLDLSRVMLTASLLFTLILLLIERGIFYRLQLLFFRRGFSRRRVVVYGAGDVGRQILKRILHSPALGMLPIGVLDDDSSLWGGRVHVPEVSAKTKGTEILGGLEQLKKLKESEGIDEVFLALPSATYDRTMEIIRACRELGLRVSIVPHTFDNQLYNLKVEELGGIPILREKRYRPNYIYLFIKRSFDILFSLAVLVLLTPIFLVAAILIPMDSAGPIIFRQKRIGRGGREFTLYKFRTLAADSPVYAVNPLSSVDRRITRVGRWLRRTSVDELPQFFNVLKGDMSVVGPRPEMPFLVDEYKDIHRERLLVKPGITGIWQISAVRGEAIHANIEYDLFYLENQSLLLDLIIVLRTVVVAIRGVGAY